MKHSKGEVTWRCGHAVTQSSVVDISVEPFAAYGQRLGSKSTILERRGERCERSELARNWLCDPLRHGLGSSPTAWDQVGLVSRGPGVGDHGACSHDLSRILLHVTLGARLAAARCVAAYSLRRGRSSEPTRARSPRPCRQRLDHLVVGRTAKVPSDRYPVWRHNLAASPPRGWSGKRERPSPGSCPTQDRHPRWCTTARRTTRRPPRLLNRDLPAGARGLDRRLAGSDSPESGSRFRTLGPGPVPTETKTLHHPFPRQLVFSGPRRRSSLLEEDRGSLRRSGPRPGNLPLDKEPPIAHCIRLPPPSPVRGRV